MKKSLSIFLIICLLIANFFVPIAKAKTLGDLKTELKNYEEQFNQTEQQKKMTEAELANTRATINSINKSITQIGDDIDSLNKEIDDLNTKIAASEKEIAEILEFVQVQNGESAYLEYAFGAQDFTDFIYRLAVSEQLTSHNDELIDDCNINIEENKQKAEELDNKKNELTTKQDSLQIETVKIQSSLESLSDDSLSLADEMSAKKSEIKIYTDKGCKDNENISTCGKSLLPADTSFWRPMMVGHISGTIGLFGWRLNPASGVYAMHYGLDLTVSGSNAGTTPAYSVANGLVVYVVSTYGSCAGKRVYIQHNVNGVIYTSGYLHLNNVYVKEGQTVTKDTIIGTLAGYPDPTYGYSDRCSTGAHLHLEISKGTFANSTYSSYRMSPTNFINFPSVGNSWTDRRTKY